MKITKIHIDGFGKLHNVDIEPGEKVTLFYGLNEAGKSTLHLFLRSIFYGASTKRRLGMPSVYERMRPWQNPEIYRGRLEVEYEYQKYLIERDFNKAADDLSIYELKKDGPAAVRNADKFLKQILNGLSETAYVNTISSGQLGAATQKDMAVELRKYTANISDSMNPGISAEGALRLLQKEKTELEAQSDGNAAKDYTAVLSEIKKLEEKLALPENENKFEYYIQTAGEIRTDRERLEGEISSNSSELNYCTESLNRLGFDNSAQIETATRDVNACFKEYEESRKAAAGKTNLVLAVLFLLAAAVTAAAAFGVSNSLIPESVLPAASGKTGMLVLLIAAALFAAVAVILLMKRSGLKKASQQAGLKLQSALSPYFGFIDPESFQRSDFEEYMERAGKMAGDVEAVRRRQEELESEAVRLNESQSDCLSNLEKQQEIKSDVEHSLTRLNELKSRAVSLQRTIRKNNILRERIDAVELAEDTIRDLASGIRSAAGTYINKNASEMVRVITNQAYDSLSAGTNYDIHLNSAEGMIPVTSLSSGTADQIYLAVRLATVRFIAGEDDPLPLLLDDSFNQFDDQRLASSLKFLVTGYRGQILIFTCRSREEQLLEEMSIDFRKITM